MKKRRRRQDSKLLKNSLAPEDTVWVRITLHIEPLEEAMATRRGLEKAGQEPRWR